MIYLLPNLHENPPLTT